MQPPEQTPQQKTKRMPVSSHIRNVEEHLEFLLSEIRSLTYGPSAWEQNIEDFRLKATTIRRILDRFHNADLPTRRYLRDHLDAEFSEMTSAFDQLRAEFLASKSLKEDQHHQAGGHACNGSSSSPSESSSGPS
jgi:predicted RNase H-like nuclease (RuvC/YqgF family)